MGTRHLIAVVKDGEYKIAQYGQWDGYPSGQGEGVLGFLSDEGNIKKLSKSLNKVRFLDYEGKDKDFIDAYEKAAPEWSNDPDLRTEEQKRWFNSYISRNIGSDILETVANSEDDEILLKDSTGFAKDSLFCEFAYVIDLDDNVFEFYKGFNKEKVTAGRFASDEEGEYQPVKLVGSYSFDSLPTVEDLESLVYDDDE